MNTVGTVICTHGIWTPGVGMYLIKRHLEREFGLRAFIFSYPSVSNTLDENAELLASFIHDNDITETHLVGHSLGGLVALRTLANECTDVPGRVVCIGSPLSGSRAAEFLHAFEWGEQLLGNSLPQGAVDSVANDWADDVCRVRDVGVIAGSIPLGVGHIVGVGGEPNDGTVTVAETQLDGAKDHIVIPVTHTGMLISREVADQTGSFLRHGEFLRE